MKIKFIKITSVLLLLFLILNAADYIFTFSSQINKYPVPRKIEFFYGDGSSWCTYFPEKKYFTEFRYRSADPQTISLLNSAVISAYKTESPADNLSFTGYSGFRKALLFLTAPVIFPSSMRTDIYPLQRMREYRNMALAGLLYSEDSLADAYMNKKNIYRSIYGLSAMAYSLHGKEPGAIPPGVLAELMRGYTARSMPAEYRPAADRFIASGRGSCAERSPFLDFCLKIMADENVSQTEAALKVYTTADQERQTHLDTAVPEYIRDHKKQDAFKKNILKNIPPLESAVVIIDTRTGALLALSSGTDWSSSDQINRAVQSRRQISSTIKPFTYAAAFEYADLTRDDFYEDKPVEVKTREGDIWRPKNFYPYFIGRATVTEAMVMSINTIAVQIYLETGAGKTRNLLTKVFRLPNNNIKARISPEPSLALGALDLTPYELAKGYLTLASMGVERYPYPIIKVTSSDGDLLLDYKNKMDSLSGKRIISEESVAEIVSMMELVIRRGTASKFNDSKLDFPLAGKSGSSPSDSWFAGFTPETLIVSWAGHDKPVKGVRLPEFIIIPMWYSLISRERPFEKLSLYD
jgi:hypothetical protein